MAMLRIALTDLPPIRAYKTLEAMLEGGSKSALPPRTERPDV